MSAIPTVVLGFGPAHCGPRIEPVKHPVDNNRYAIVSSEDER
jgi:hypothetical protein